MLGAGRADRRAAARRRLGGAERGGRRRSRRVPTPETKPPSLLGLRAVEVRPGAHVPDDRRGVRDPDGRAAVLQRVRHAPGAVESVHRRAGDLRGAAAEPAAAADLRGRPAAARLRQRLRRRARVPAGARRPRRAADRRFNVGSGEHLTVARSPTRMAAALGRATSSRRSPAVPRRRHPPLLRRHRAGQRAARLPSRRSRSRTGSSSWPSGSSGQQAIDRVGRRGRSSRPGADGMTRAARDGRRTAARGDSAALITGGAGFIGTNLADRLLSRRPAR